MVGGGSGGVQVGRIDLLGTILLDSLTIRAVMFTTF